MAKPKKIDLATTTDGAIGSETAMELTGNTPAPEPEEPRNVKFLINLTPSVYEALMGACVDQRISASGVAFSLIKEWTERPENVRAKEHYEEYNGPYRPAKR